MQTSKLGNRHVAKVSKKVYAFVGWEEGKSEHITMAEGHDFDLSSSH